MEQDVNNAISDESMFETMFRWKLKWAAIIVKPVIHEGRFLHYIVKWIGGPVFFIWKNQAGQWEELKKGTTDRSRAAGKAIEDSTLVRA
ncbi:MAG: hypothetical protein ABI687_07095 [Flavitalea sp.]